jgi:HAE1 family hydrophobic/amphiphilic exporter-1
MEGIEEAVEELNQAQVPAQGLILRQVYDETVYIKSSVGLVRQNVYIGGTLAALILLLFLRSWRATLIVSLAIPVSVIGSFVAMAALGRSINVISLAGLAFAVGMVVDAAIVVLENIYRLREAGKPARLAAYEGTRQVWGAVLVSALTTVMVFIPILIMELEWASCSAILRSPYQSRCCSRCWSRSRSCRRLPAACWSIRKGKRAGESPSG